MVLFPESEQWRCDAPYLQLWTVTVYFGNIQRQHSRHTANMRLLEGYYEATDHFYRIVKVRMVRWYWSQSKVVSLYSERRRTVYSQWRCRGHRAPPQAGVRRLWWVTSPPCLLVSLSPCLLASLPPCLLVSTLISVFQEKLTLSCRKSQMLPTTT